MLHTRMTSKFACHSRGRSNAARRQQCVCFSARTLTAGATAWIIARQYCVIAARGHHAAAGERDNNFGSLRLLFAALVIVSHSPELMDGNRSREILTQDFGTLSFGDLAVGGPFYSQRLSRR
jgi:hypothetical protein